MINTTQQLLKKYPGLPRTFEKLPPDEKGYEAFKYPTPDSYVESLRSYAKVHGVDAEELLTDYHRVQNETLKRAFFEGDRNKRVGQWWPVGGQKNG